jgi:gamma-glutamylcyclotransferase (GGCT)/AIG2-like uncharacterized protein YtfP|tara:strand:- start:426 stop:797 length:372 start_codon:yes stop_codon:yes gene_type:complete
MKTNKLAVYGTLRNGNRDTWKVDGFSLVFPGHRIYPAAMIDSNAKDMVVEVVDVDEQDIAGYDRYESIDTGLYERRIVKVRKDDKEIDAWMYTIGPALLQGTKVFQQVPKQDWFSKECLNLRK